MAAALPPMKTPSCFSVFDLHNETKSTLFIDSQKTFRFHFLWAIFINKANILTDNFVSLSGVFLLLGWTDVQHVNTSFSFCLF